MRGLSPHVVKVGGGTEAPLAPYFSVSEMASDSCQYIWHGQNYILVFLSLRTRISFIKYMLLMWNTINMTVTIILSKNQ